MKPLTWRYVRAAKLCSSITWQTGELIPLYCTSHGKARLTDFDEPALKALFGTAPLERLTKQTLTSTAQLARACRQIQTRGYAIDDCEYMGGVRCVAAPIRDQEGGVIASIGVSAPLARFPRDRDKGYGGRMIDIAQQIGD